MTINHFILQKKHSFILNDNKDKKHIILFQKFIAEDIVLPVQNLGGGAFAPLSDASYGPGLIDRENVFPHFVKLSILMNSDWTGVPQALKRAPDPPFAPKAFPRYQNSTFFFK